MDENNDLDSYNGDPVHDGWIDFDYIENTGELSDLFDETDLYNTPRFSDRHNYGGMTRNRYICKKEENQNGKTI